MTAIVAAIAGTGQNVIYANGLYNTSYGVELSPIDIGNQSSETSGPFNLTYQWIGYYKAATSSAVQLGAVCNYAEYLDYYAGTVPYNWGGGGNSTCYIWTGNTAKSGYNSGNYTALIQNGTGGANFTAAANSYTPIRIQWSTYLPWYEQYTFYGTYTYFALSNFTFTIAGTSAVSGRIWYNSLTNGF